MLLNSNLPKPVTCRLSSTALRRHPFTAVPAGFNSLSLDRSEDGASWLKIASGLTPGGAYQDITGLAEMNQNTLLRYRGSKAVNSDDPTICTNYPKGPTVIHYPDGTTVTTTPNGTTTTTEPSGNTTTTNTPPGTTTTTNPDGSTTTTSPDGTTTTTTPNGTSTTTTPDGGTTTTTPDGGTTTTAPGGTSTTTTPGGTSTTTTPGGNTTTTNPDGSTTTNQSGGTTVTNPDGSTTTTYPDGTTITTRPGGGISTSFPDGTTTTTTPHGACQCDVFLKCTPDTPPGAGETDEFSWTSDKGSVFRMGYQTCNLVMGCGETANLVCTVTRRNASAVVCHAQIEYTHVCPGPPDEGGGE